MKKILFLLAMVFLISPFTQAQIIEKNSNMSLGVQTGNQVILDNIEDGDAADLWEDYFEDRYDEKVRRNRRADEYYSTGVRINSIFSVANIDVYTKFDERGSNTMMTLWVDMGMAFVNSKDYPTEYEGVVALLEDFRIFAKTYAVSQEYEKAEELLEDMKDDLDKLEKKNGRMHEKIADYEEKILETQGEIEQNLIEQDEKKVEIDRQIEVLRQIQTRLDGIKKLKAK